MPPPDAKIMCEAQWESTRQCEDDEFSEEV